MYRIVIVFLLLFTIACGEADREPEGILSKEDMRDVLIDMNMADVYSNETGDRGLPLPDSLRQHNVKIYYTQILQLHKLTVKQFKASYDFYESHPDRFAVVYNMMKDVVASQKDIVENEGLVKDYLKDPQSPLPFGKNVLISATRDTIIPFVKKNKRAIPVLKR
jgi:hypothetical protein